MAVSDSKVADLGNEIKKKVEERNVIENRLQEAAREPGMEFGFFFLFWIIKLENLRLYGYVL